MKSKFLFSGKSISTGDTVFGSLVYSKQENQYYIVEHNGEELSWEVYEDSIKQVFEKPLTYREQLQKIQQFNISVCDLEIANECDCIFEFVCTEEEFEQLCEFAKTVYLKAEEMTANAVAKTINELIVYSGYSIEQVLSMNIWEAINKASYNL